MTVLEMAEQLKEMVDRGVVDCNDEIDVYTHEHTFRGHILGLKVRSPGLESKRRLDICIAE